ncbi:hypothetical protein SKAU_G00040780 [Synaphobranchus kaupii]|uniref:E3 ubiquitin-protein ligase Mdm2 n=1 Tax=Synaphobranchus kaupii TaxID=118154 RepID=A0A9Q1G1X6_SYNKA|nr:hypothetical protein SKAU_G00040780 [Synaphobranchus kaupii]
MQVTDRMATDNCLSSSQISVVDNEKLVRPKVQLQTLLQHAGASKDIYTLKEVMFYLGQYIMSKQLYDKKQQHIVHCADDALGSVLGVDSFSVKEPRVLYAMISKNLIAVKDQDSQFTEPRSQSEPDRGPEETDSDSQSSTSARRRRRRRSSDPAGSSTEEDQNERRKRHKSDSFSFTFDDSLSWCVIGGLRRDRGSSESSDSRSNTEVGVSVCEDSDDSLSQDSDCDNFSVEFEVESIDSEAYSENDEASVASGEEEVYEVTIFGAEDEDSFDEDTEITEADYWKCTSCEELNPPLPRNCKRCWTLRQDWLPEPNPKALPLKPPAPAAAAADGDVEEGLDVPDGKRARSPPAAPESKEDSACESQEANSQPSTSGASSTPSSQDDVPELERFNSLEACLPASCLEPCVICQSRPKNGCIVHGRTGHLMACYTCAKKLKNRNKLCPVCREPIQSVVLTYLS